MNLEQQALIHLTGLLDTRRFQSANHPRTNRLQPRSRTRRCHARPRSGFGLFAIRLQRLKLVQVIRYRQPPASVTLLAPQWSKYRAPAC